MIITDIVIQKINKDKKSAPKQIGALIHCSMSGDILGYALKRSGNMPDLQAIDQISD